MKKTKILIMFMAVALLFSSCGTLNNTAKGGLIGAGGGAAVGSLIGGLIGKGRGAAIGAAVGTAVGTGAGVLIGKKMDIAAEEAAKIEGATVEQVTDNNGLKAVKVTFESGILFKTGAAKLSADAQQSLTNFANDVLKQNADMDVEIYGYTDNQGWRRCTPEQSKQKNVDLSMNRAQSVSDYLLAKGVAEGQIKAVQGLGEENPVADNSTEAGRQENRRVEIFMYASEEMIKQAESGELN